jgi:hypothetical protein
MLDRSIGRRGEARPYHLAIVAAMPKMRLQMPAVEAMPGA